MYALCTTSGMYKKKRKKRKKKMDVIFNIIQVEMSCVTFVSIQHDPFIKYVK